MSTEINYTEIRAQLVKDVEAKQAALALAQDKLAKFDAFANTGVHPTPTLEAAPKATKTVSASQEKATEGRRAVAQGVRPTIKEAVRQVMGDQMMNAEQIYDGLQARNWLPNSKDPKQYIRYTLSSNNDVFERITGQRGFYKVSKMNGAAHAPKAKSAPAAAPKVAKGPTRGKAAPKVAKAAPKVNKRQAKAATPAKQTTKKAPKAKSTSTPNAPAALASVGLDPKRDASFFQEG